MKNANSNIIRKLQLSLATVATGIMAFAASYTVPDGATIAMGGVRKDKFEVNGEQVENSYANTLVLEKDATLKFTAKGFVGCALKVDNGTLTFDLTELPDGEEVTLDNGVKATGSGAIVVKGRDSIRLGGTYSIGNNYSPPACCANITYLDAEGAAYENPTGLILTGRFLEWKLPAKWSLEAGAVVTIGKNGSAILASMMKDGTLEVADNDVWLYVTNALTAFDTPIKVKSGCELVLIPRSIDDSEYFSQSGSGTMVYGSPVEVESGATLNLRNHYYMQCVGAITGSGTLKHTATKDNNGGHSVLSNSSGFSGNISMETPGNPLDFGTATVGNGQNAITMAAGTELRVGTGLWGGEISGEIGTIAGPESGSASVTLGPNSDGSFAIGGYSGNVTFIGRGYDKTLVTFGSVAVGGMITVENDTYKAALTSAAKIAAGVFALTRSSGRNAYVRSASAEAVDFADFEIPASDNFMLAAADGVKYENVSENIEVQMGEGVSATVNMVNGGEAKLRMTGGAATVTKLNERWKEKLAFWADFSKADTIVSSKTRTLSKVDYKMIERVNDVRSEQTDVYLTYYSSTDSTWPTLMTDGPGGLSYMSCDLGGNRRLWFDRSGVASKMVIMVFGSQLGGGRGIIGNMDDYYVRGGTISRTASDYTQPIFQSAIDTWVNGDSVDATQRSLSGGWEIISVDTSGANVHGFGFSGSAGTASNAKGQNYGEILMFGEMPTEEERMAAELYLAKKWGLRSDYHDQSELKAKIRAEGTGTITLTDDTALSGSFTGTVNLNGNTLEVTDDELPPDESAVPDAGRLVWFDPSDKTTIGFGSKEGAIYGMYDCKRGMTEGAIYLNAAGRQPYLLENNARGFGPERNWVDYSPAWFYKEDEGNYGRVLRFNTYPESSKDVSAVSARTVFVIQDSVKGGGSPFLSAVNGSGDILCRLTKYGQMDPDCGLPIWRDTTADIFASGATYLDGHAVDGRTSGFQGRPELLTAVGGQNFTLGVFGYYNYLQDIAENVDYGEVQGEIIAYDCELSETVRKQVEAYLMWKWLGVARDGYSVMANTTVTGSGTLKVAAVSQMPKVAADFSGTMQMVESAYAFAIDGDGVVSGAIDAGEGVLAFPAACTANVTLANGVPAGEYILASGSAFAGDTVWQLNLTAPSTRCATLSATGGKVKLTVTARGFTVIVR